MEFMGGYPTTGKGKTSSLGEIGGAGGFEESITKTAFAHKQKSRQVGLIQAGKWKEGHRQWGSVKPTLSSKIKKSRGNSLGKGKIGKNRLSKKKKNG